MRLTLKYVGMGFQTVDSLGSYNKLFLRQLDRCESLNSMNAEVITNEKSAHLTCIIWELPSLFYQRILQE